MKFKILCALITIILLSEAKPSGVFDRIQETADVINSDAVGEIFQGIERAFARTTTHRAVLTTLDSFKDELKVEKRARRMMAKYGLHNSSPSLLTNHKFIIFLIIISCLTKILLQ